MKLSNFTAFQYISLIEGHNSLHAFGDLSKKHWGTRVNLSTAFHPQTDEQFEHTIQFFEDMLRNCILDFGYRSPIGWFEVGEANVLGPDSTRSY